MSPIASGRRFEELGYLKHNQTLAALALTGRHIAVPDDTIHDRISSDPLASPYRRCSRGSTIMFFDRYNTIPTSPRDGKRTANYSSACLLR